MAVVFATCFALERLLNLCVREKALVVTTAMLQAQGHVSC